MIKIEEFSRKFNKMKNKLEINMINDLTTNNYKSILYILNKNPKNILFQNQKKEKKSLKPPIPTNPENNPNSKIKEKNKFYTKKYPEQNIFTATNISKEKSPINPSKKNNSEASHNLLNFNQNQTNNNIDYNNNTNNNSINNNTSMTNNNISANLNLLVLATGNYTKNDVTKFFEKDEEKKILKENKKKEENENMKNISEAEGEGDIEDDSDFYDDEIDKNKTVKKDNINLIMSKKDSVINLNQKFDIFDETKMMIDDEDMLNNNMEYGNDYDDYNTHEIYNKQNDNNTTTNNINNDKIFIYEETKKNNNGNKTKSKLNKDKDKEKNRIHKEKDKEKDKEKNRIHKEKDKEKNRIYKEKDKEKDKEKNRNNKKENIQNEENNKIDNDNNNNNYDNNINNNNSILGTTNNNLKIAILLDEDDLNDEIMDNNYEEKNKSEKKLEITPTKHNEEKNKEKEIKKKEKDYHQNPIRKKNIKSKSCYNALSSNTFITNKIKQKVIMDDDEEENIDINNKDNIKDLTSNNNINTNDIYLSSSKKNKDKNNYDNNNNNKNDKFDDPILKNEGNKFTLVLDNDNSTNINNNTNNNNIQKKNINKEKEKDKEKENYDLVCINNISKILAQIEDKLKKENYEKKIDNKCYEMINRIKSNNTDLKKRKRNTYLCILKILELLFYLLKENKKCKIYTNDILIILDIIYKYFQNIKKYDSSINDIPYFYKKKIAFKYIYSSLELKTYDNNSLKDITRKNDTNTNSNNNDLLKFTKIFKRYKKSSEYLIKELKLFKEKLNNPLYKTKSNVEYLNKYENCPTNIQTLPNFINYIKLFNHYFIMLNFFNDCKKFMEEIGKKDGFIDNNKRDKSVKVKNEYDNKNKNRERSRYKEIEKDKERNKK